MVFVGIVAPEGSYTRNAWLCQLFHHGVDVEWGIECVGIYEEMVASAGVVESALACEARTLAFLVEISYSESLIDILRFVGRTVVDTKYLYRVSCLQVT